MRLYFHGVIQFEPADNKFGTFSIWYDLTWRTYTVRVIVNNGVREVERRTKGLTIEQAFAEVVAGRSVAIDQKGSDPIPF